MKKAKNLLKSILGTVFIAMLFPIMSCDSAHPSKLVGYWVLYDYKSNNAMEQFGFLLTAIASIDNSIELFDDGTGVETASNMIGSKNVRFSWKVENKRFIKTSKSSIDVSDYKISGDSLIFTYDDGTKLIYLTKEAAKKAAEKAAKAKEARQDSIAKAVEAKYAKVKKGYFDERDNKTYKTVKLDKQIWMAENLNYNATDSKCYENQESNCQRYGRLYNWGTAKSACPKGWHLPSDAEWENLVQFVGCGCCEVAGNMLKASNGWNNYEGKSGNGENKFGFSALPGGSGTPNGDFYSVGNYGYWWGRSTMLPTRTTGT